jgi:hypothetical protein
MAREPIKIPVTDFDKGKPIPAPETTTTHVIHRVPAAESAIERSITCLTCHRTSYNPGDVLNRYCGFCKKFHGRESYQVDPRHDWAWITDRAHVRDGAVYDVNLQSPTGATTGGSMTVARVWFRLDAYGMATAAELVHRVYRSDPLWRLTFDRNDGMTEAARDWNMAGDFCALAVFTTRPASTEVKVARLHHVPDIIGFLLHQLSVWLPGMAAGRAAAAMFLKRRGDYTPQEVALLEGEWTPDELDAELARVAAMDQQIAVMKAGVGLELTEAELREMNDAKDAAGDVPFDRQAGDELPFDRELDDDGDICDRETAAREAKYQADRAAAAGKGYADLVAAQRRAAADPLPAALRSPENAAAYFQVDQPGYDSDEYVLPALAAIGQLWGFRPFPPGTRYYVDERDDGDDELPTIVLFGPIAKVYRTSGELVVDPAAEDAQKCTTFQLLLTTDQRGINLFNDLRQAKEDEIYHRRWVDDAHHGIESLRTVTEVDFSKVPLGRGCDHAMPVAQYVLSNPLAATVARWKAGH